MRRLLNLRAAERNVPRYLEGAKCVLQMEFLMPGSPSKQWQGFFEPNPTDVQDKDFDVTTGWFVPLHFMVARLGNIQI
jgi:hypothetical protein